jgi:hypothetical protein
VGVDWDWERDDPTDQVCLCVYAGERETARERDVVCVREWVSVCVREKDRVCVCEREGEGVCVCVCVCV